VPWRDVRGIGNQLCHAYERIDLATIWNTVIEDLPALKTAVKHALNQSRALVAPAPMVHAVDGAHAEQISSNLSFRTAASLYAIAVQEPVVGRKGYFSPVIRLPDLVRPSNVPSTRLIS
jgi:hypothetical protein